MIYLAQHTLQPREKYEVRQIEAWAGDEEGMWTENQSWHMGCFLTRCESREAIGRALTRYLKTKHKIVFKLNRTLIEGDYERIEIVDRKTKEPLFAAIWCQPH